MKWEKEIIRSTKIIENGGNILCPTDTIWGISADANNEQAVEKVFQIKNRPTNKSMIVLVANEEMLKYYVEEISEQALLLIRERRTPTTIIYPKGKNLAKNVLASNGSVGIRIVNDNFCQPLILKLGKAIISTSANISGKPLPVSFNEVSAKIKNAVNYIVNIPNKENSTSTASIIYLIDGEKVKRIR